MFRHNCIDKFKYLLSTSINNPNIEYFLISKLGCPCCITVNRLLTNSNYYNLPEIAVVEIIDVDSKDILHSIKADDGSIKSEYSDFLIKDENDSIADTYPCVFAKVTIDSKTYFKYLPEGKDGMLTRFAKDVRKTHPQAYNYLVANLIEFVINNDNARLKLFFDYIQNQLKPSEEELENIVKETKELEI